MISKWVYVLEPLAVLIVFSVMILAVLLIFAWIWMIIDCLQRNFKEGSERIAWILVLLLLPLVGLLLYYFIIYRKDKKVRRKR